MDNNKVKEIIQAIGVMTELWKITYTSFVNSGMQATEAIMHTKEFMAVLIDVMNNGTKGE